MTENIENLLIKFLSGSANTIELDELHRWILETENEPIFQEFIRTHYSITLGMNEPDKDEIREKLLKEIRKEKNIFQRRRFRKVLKYAALAVFFIGTGYFLRENLSGRNKDNIIKPSQHDIVLELENGRKKIIKKGGSIQLTDAKGNLIGRQTGSNLVYQRPQSGEKPIYNTLTIPYGKRFDLVLSDGTRVYLNSGSTIKYPSYFINERKREVFLEGEAFFEVAHDNSQSFHVNANEIQVTAYGTKFDVSTYPEDLEATVVLVSGSVGLTSPKEHEPKSSVLLEPGFKGVFDKNHKIISTEKVDTSLYTSWLNGNLVFRNESFKDILQELERKYNVVIINNNDQLAGETFNATFEVDRETIEQVFNYFKRIYQIEYEVFDNKIIIN